MSWRLHGYPWPSLATSPYRSSPLAGLQGYIPYPHIATVCMFELVALLFLGHMWGSIGVHHAWAPPCFSSSVLHVWFIYLGYFIYIYHHVVPQARISLTHSRHFSLSFIAFDRSSGLHPISSYTCCMYVRAGRTAFARPYLGVHWSTSLKHTRKKMEYRKWSAINSKLTCDKIKDLSVVPRSPIGTCIFPWLPSRLGL